MRGFLRENAASASGEKYFVVLTTPIDTRPRSSPISWRKPSSHSASADEIRASYPEQIIPRVRRSQSIGRAVEEGKPHALLQQLQLQGHGRRRNAQLLGCSGNSAVVRNCSKRTQLAQCDVSQNL